VGARADLHAPLILGWTSAGPRQRRVAMRPPFELEMSSVQRCAERRDSGLRGVAELTAAAAFRPSAIVG
jgi:hypothetical protein